MAITADDAAAARAEAWEPGAGQMPTASAIGGSDLWAVRMVDTAGRSAPGRFDVVGPDRRLWEFSSNGGIHDPALVVSVLTRVYSRGVSHLVDDDLLRERIEAITRASRDQFETLLEDASAGALRGRRRLPLP